MVVIILTIYLFFSRPFSINGVPAVYENKQDRTTHKILEKTGVLCKLTEGYWRDLEKPVDLCTLLYHQGAHIPSNSLGPASHLKRGNSVN
jgi:hypothetical protein